MFIPFRTKSIQNQLTLIFISIVVITVLPLAFFVAFQSWSQYKISYDQSIDQQMHLVDSTVKNYAQNIMSSTKTLAELPIMKEADNRITSYQTGNAVSGFIEMNLENKSLYEQDVYQILKTFQMSHPSIKNASLGVESNGGFVMYPPKPRFLGYDARQREWYQKAIASPNQVVISGIYTTSSDENVVLCVSSVMDSANTLKGVITVDFDLSALSESIGSINIGANGYLILADAQGIILAHAQNPELVGTNIFDSKFSNISRELLETEKSFISSDATNDEFYIKTYTSSLTSFPLYYLAVLPKAELYSNSIKLVYNLFGAFILLILISFALSYFTAKHFTKPLIKISEVSEKISSGELYHRLETELQRKDEIGELANKFNIMIGAIEEAQKTLEEKVSARTLDFQEANENLIKINSELTITLEELKSTQNQLIISEKLASLGRLVSGIAHEINTPLGVGVTASTYIDKLLKEISNSFESKTLTQTELANYIFKSTESVDVLVRNLERAADLIQNFKQVAVDQSSEIKRNINVKDYIDGILKSLYPHLKNRKISINVICENDLSVDTYPGALAQIITNFVMNSIIHGYDIDDNGIIDIVVFVEAEQFHLKYSDDGKGISKTIKAKIFEPFNTSKRNQGGFGLGLHIIYNIVQYKLNGSISLEQESKKGSHFHLQWPI